MEGRGDTGEKGSPLDPKWYVRGLTFVSVGSSLNGRSFQDALRAFFQPIKNDDPRLDFYTMYKREATEYDADYVKKYDDDLSTTLIFVRRLSFFTLATYLTCPLGWSVLCRQFCLRHRRPLKARTRSERAISGPPPCNPSHPQSIHYPERTSRRSTRPGGSSQRYRHRYRTHVRESADLIACRIPCDAG